MRLRRRRHTGNDVITVTATQIDTITTARNKKKKKNGMKGMKKRWALLYYIIYEKTAETPAPAAETHYPKSRDPQR